MLKFDGYQEILNAITLELMAPHQRFHDEETHLHNIVRSLNGMSMLNYYPESMVDSCFSSMILNSKGKHVNYHPNACCIFSLANKMS
jgi:hypothetical protein